MFDANNKSHLEDQLVEAITRVDSNFEREYAIFLTGDSLIQIMENDFQRELIELSEKASTLVACRVSPKQKLEVVKLVRKFKPNVRTLAIGDGANDVNMISGAHVGVGIMGLEVFFFQLKKGGASCKCC